MADALTFELVAPERLLFSGKVESVTVPGTEGDFTVLVRHAPVLSTVRPGVITVREDGKSEDRIFVRGGFAEVSNDVLTVLAEEAIPLKDLDKVALDQQVSNAEEDVKDAGDDKTRARAQEALDHLRQLQAAL